MNGDLGLGIVVSMKDAFTRTAHNIQGAMNDLDATVAASSERMTRNMDRIQKGTMLVGAGLSLMAVPTALIASTAATQKALGELSSVGVTDLKALENAAESFTNRWAGANKAQFINAAYDVKSALANLSDEAVGVFTGMAALTGKATKASTDEMVGTFTTAYGIYKPIMKDMNDMEWAQAFSGGLAQTVAAFKTTGSQMSDAIKNIGAVAAASNIPMQEQLAILGQLQTTMPGSEAGTLYKAFIMKAAEAGKELGLSFIDSTGRLKGVIPILKEIQGKFPDLSQAASQVQLKKAFGSDEAMKFILQMSAGIDSLQGNITSIGDAMKTGTVLTEKMANAMNQDIGAQWELVRQQTMNLAEILGSTLLPVVTPIMKGLSKVILTLQGWAKSMPGVTRAVLTFTLVLGAILTIAGAVTAAIGTVGIMIPAIEAGLAAIGGIAAGVGAAIGTYLFPVIAIAAGVALAVYLLKKAWETNFGGIRDFVTGLWDTIKLAFEGISTLIGSLNGNVGQMSAELAQKLQNAGLLDFVVTVFMLYYRVREYLTGLWEGFSGAFGKIKAILEPVVRSVLSAYMELGKAFFSIFKIFGMVNTATDGSGFRTYGQAIGSVLGVVAQLGAYLIKFMIYPTIWVITLLAKTIEGFVWFTQIVASGLVTAGKFAYEFLLPVRMMVAMFEMLGTTVAAVWGVVSGDISVTEGLRMIGQSALDYLATPFIWARDMITGVWNYLSSLFTSMGGIFTGAANQMLGALLQIPFVQTLQGVFGGIMAFLNGGILPTFFESGRKLFTTLADGMISAVKAPVDAIKSGLGKVREYLPFSDAKVGPLSSLTASGQALLGTIAEGMEQARSVPAKVFDKASGTITAGMTSLGQYIGTQGEKIQQGLSTPVSGLSSIWAGVSGGASSAMQVVTGALNSAKSVLAKPLAVAAPLLPVNPFRAIESGISTVQETARQMWSNLKGSVLPSVSVPAQAQSPMAAPVKQPPIGQTIPAANPVLAAGQNIFDGIMNIAPKLNGALIPRVMQAALSLTPILSGTVPAMAAPISVPVSHTVSTVVSAKQNGEVQQPQTAAPVSTPQTIDKGTVVERPVPFNVPGNAGSPAPAQNNAALAMVQEFKSAMMALVNRPVEVNVASHIDGRKVAEAVYRDMQDKKVRNYETL